MFANTTNHSSGDGDGLAGPSDQHSPPLSAGQTAHQQRIRRRNRLITSCLECRRRKLKCDKTSPCANCVKFNRDCLFLAPALDHASQAKIAEIKEKMGTLERTLEEDVARKRAIKREMSTGDHIPGQDQSSDEEGTPPEDEKDLEINTLALDNVVYGGEPDDDVQDLGILIGKMRITDRVGGYFRPKMYEEMADTLRRLTGIDTEEVPPAMRDTSGSLVASEYVPPNSSFFFAPPIPRQQPLSGQRSTGAFGSIPIMQYLPQRAMADKLMYQYWLAVHPLCRIVHRPSFERQYDMFWRNMHIGIASRNSFMALLFSLLFSAVVSMPEDSVYETYTVEKQQLVENFREGTELALSQANFLRSTQLETLQAFTAYMIPLCRSAISRGHAALTGTAIRLAECMGLHRDGSNFGISPVETHVRRLVWFQLCALDLRTCEACGPRPQIRMDDYDTKFPLNVDDADLESATPPVKDSNMFTDVTLSRIRFECNEIHRMLWFERPKIGKGKVTITSLLGKCERFKQAMEKKYYSMLNLHLPLHFMTLQVYKILSLRLHAMLLHRYASNAQRVMPDRLRNIMMSSVTLLMEHAITIETNPALTPWSWLSGAMQQWHVALLMMGELYAKPPPKAEEERIWKSLDYAFELPPHLTPIDKVKVVLGDLRGKSEVYQRLHRIHMPKIRTERESEYVKKMGENDPIRPSVSPPPAIVGMATPTLNRPASAGYHNQIPTTSAGMSLGNATGAIAPTDFQSNNMHGFGESFYAPHTALSQQPHLAGIMNSPPGSDGSANLPGQVISGGSPGGEVVIDIDWNEWDKLFPQAQNADPNNINIPPFSFPESMGGNLSWQYPPGQYPPQQGF
ncbi:hypothetical protein EJ05DRAFT_378902 [Pseudovirgaria hyperparasitica]|uniref:Zn(2)-C6 fungal-type domain-containing protein n=1 Tax=Pseudovirgaria hyperparasitica TaxID=470096 RepID=A0A6A6W5I8_9PEZI|nr:uncharacterized protein EJ05DRAFT_378902 [Pseudovirgaria hyperparasitica]KAF2758142.1 hypothetical protein EJ05DRAFT_378902 [Pseudovirgaria hyperparasitica]